MYRDGRRRNYNCLKYDVNQPNDLLLHPKNLMASDELPHNMIPYEMFDWKYVSIEDLQQIPQTQ